MTSVRTTSPTSTNERAAAQRNRQMLPNVAALVDEWRSEFPDLKVIWAKDLETGREVGVRPQPVEVFDIPQNYYPTQQIETRKGKKR